MGFEIRVNGKTVHTVDVPAERVSKVTLTTSKGETGQAGIDLYQDFVDLIFSYRSDSSLEIKDYQRALEQAEVEETNYNLDRVDETQEVTEVEETEDEEDEDPEEDQEPASVPSLSL